MIIPLPPTGLYFPHHPHAGSPTFTHRLACLLAGHSLVLSHLTLGNQPPAAYAICATCGLYLMIQYPPSPKPIVTLPSQASQY